MSTLVTHVKIRKPGLELGPLEDGVLFSVFLGTVLGAERVRRSGQDSWLPGIDALYLTPSD